LFDIDSSFERFRNKKERGRKKEKKKEGSKKERSKKEKKNIRKKGRKEERKRERKKQRKKYFELLSFLPLCSVFIRIPLKYLRTAFSNPSGSCSRANILPSRVFQFLS